MTGDDNPWSPDHVPPVRSEDVPAIPPGGQWPAQWPPQGPPQAPGWGHGMPQPPKPRRPESLVATSTISAFGAWGALICIALGHRAWEEAERTTGYADIAGDWAIGIGIVFLSLIGGICLVAALVAGVFAGAQAAMWFGERRTSPVVTVAVVHAGLAWLALLVNAVRWLA